MIIRANVELDGSKMSESVGKFVTAILHLKCICCFEMNGHVHARACGASVDGLNSVYKIHKAFNEMSF